MQEARWVPFREWAESLLGHGCPGQGNKHACTHGGGAWVYFPEFDKEDSLVVNGHRHEDGTSCVPNNQKGAIKNHIGLKH